MRNLSKLVFQRVVAVSVGILLQIGFLIVMATYLRADFFWIRIAMNVLSWAMVIYIISCGVNPSYKIAWIVLILAFPVAGLTIYLLFGGNKISSYEHRKMQSIEAVTMQQLQQEEEPLWELAAARTPAFNHARYLLSASGYPIYDDADATYFPSGESCYAAMLEELQKAEHYIFIEFFIIAQGKMWDPILQILREKAAAGVDVRVVYDDFGCITRLPMQYAKKLREMGIRAHAFNPYVPILSARLNNRDHRKLMIIDGRAAFTGGVNLADEYINELERFGRWKDCGILVRGKAVWSMTVMFLSLWGYVDRCEEDVSRFRVACAEKQGGTGFLQPFADSPLDNEDVGATMLQSVISSAQERRWIMTPYLILDDKMTTALCVAAKTGVDVRIITPAIPDKWYVHAVTRANYEELTRAGVRIYEYTPGFIHSKVYLADSAQAVVGTVNLDFRSLYLHFEDAVYLCDTAANAQIEEDFVQTFPQCRAITYEQCRHVHLYQRILRALLRMFAPLM